MKFSEMNETATADLKAEKTDLKSALRKVNKTVSSDDRMTLKKVVKKLTNVQDIVFNEPDFRHGTVDFSITDDSGASRKFKIISIKE